MEFRKILKQEYQEVEPSYQLEALQVPVTLRLFIGRICWFLVRAAVWVTARRLDTNFPEVHDWDGL